MPRNTTQKSAITTAIDESGRPLTAQEILESAQKVVPTLGIATVYRQLKRLVEHEEIQPVELPGEPARYESAHHDHHHHFHCQRCGRVFDVPGCHAHIDSGVPAGFVVERHEVVLYGSCAECAN
jgi:Fur family ferric uptake transcriptional regulator